VSALWLSNNTNGDGQMFGLLMDLEVKSGHLATVHWPTFIQVTRVNSHNITINIILLLLLLG